MKIQIKNIKNNEVVDITLIQVNSEDEMNAYVKDITAIFAIKKFNLVKSGLPFEEVNENGFFGLISDSFQFIQYDNYYEFTEGDTTTQITLIAESVSIAA